MKPGPKLMNVWVDIPYVLSFISPYYDLKADDKNHDVPLEETEAALADATADLELSEGISSNVVERFRRFEKEVSHITKLG